MECSSPANQNRVYIFTGQVSLLLYHDKMSLLSKAELNGCFRLAHLVGQRADDDAEVRQGAVYGRHLFEALTLRLALHHALTASQVHQTQGSCV